MIAGVGAALASLVAVARVLGGMHFVTDAIGGAVVGTAMACSCPLCTARHYASPRPRRNIDSSSR